MTVHWRVAAAMVAVLACIAALYWPVTHAGFVWDDVSSIHDDARLRNEEWKHVIFRGFNDWLNYFRPLVVLLFVTQVRAFDAMPGPMHAISLALHLADTLLVGLLAWKLSPRGARSTPLVATAMLFYGLHPALIETTAWIGCQFELVVTFFIAMGLLLDVSLRSASTRALGVGICFLLAACAKESAIAFAPLLVLFDLHGADGSDWRERLRTTWLRQSGVYAAVLIAGIAYLALRAWALGYVLAPSRAEPLLSYARLQQVGLTYFSYWKLIVWPMTSVGVLHDVDDTQFARLTPASLGVDATALAILLGGLWAFWKRLTLGTAILAASAALVPVLHLVPIGFNEGLYNDRYATIAIAAICALLPALAAPLLAHVRLMRLVAPIAALLWLGLAVANIRVTVPLWADEVALWQWALRQNPDSVSAQAHLLSTYFARDDRAHARVLADRVVAEHPDCLNCLLNAANLAIADNDATRAALALGKIKDSRALAHNNSLLRSYVFDSGELLELQGDRAGAEEAYRDAITLDPFDPMAQIMLAMLLAQEGRVDEARRTEATALPLFAPDERTHWRAAFAQALTAAARPQ